MLQVCSALGRSVEISFQESLPASPKSGDKVSIDFLSRGESNLLLFQYRGSYPELWFDYFGDACWQFVNEVPDSIDCWWVALENKNFAKEIKHLTGLWGLHALSEQTILSSYCRAPKLETVSWESFNFSESYVKDYQSRYQAVCLAKALKVSLQELVGLVTQLYESGNKEVLRMDIKGALKELRQMYYSAPDFLPWQRPYSLRYTELPSTRRLDLSFETKDERQSFIDNHIASGTGRSFIQFNALSEDLYEVFTPYDASHLELVFTNLVREGLSQEPEHLTRATKFYGFK